MKKLIIICLLLVSAFAYANKPKSSCKVELLLSTKVYTECDFRSEPLTYLKKGIQVELIGYHKGFYTLLINNQKAYITEANIKPNQEFIQFKNYIFSSISNEQKQSQPEETPDDQNQDILASN